MSRRDEALEKAKTNEDARAMQRIAKRLAGRGFDHAVVMATMVRLATEAALVSADWSDAEADADASRGTA